MYPFVLHVGAYPIGAPNNTGLTLQSMFSDFPPGTLRQGLVTDQYLEHEHLGSPEIQVFPPSHAPLEMTIRGTWRRVADARKRLRQTTAPAAPRENDGLNNSIRRNTSQMSRQDRARLSIGTIIDVAPVRMSSPIIRPIVEFQPEVIHSLLGSVRVMRATLALSKKLGLPIVPHFMDDWAPNLFTAGQLGGLARHETERAFKNILNRSPVLLTIGEDMANEFRSRYGRPCIVVGNSLDEIPHDRSSDPGPPTLRYVGGLHLGRAEEISQVASALRRDPEMGSWVLEVFVPQTDATRAGRLAAEHSNLRHRGTLRPADVMPILQGATALLFVESGDPATLRFTHLSVSTKVPQYLLASRPILAVGPASQSSIRELTSSGRAVHYQWASDVQRTRSGPAPVFQALREMAALDPLPALTQEQFDRFDGNATRERLRRALLDARGHRLPL